MNCYHIRRHCFKPQLNSNTAASEWFRVWIFRRLCTSENRDIHDVDVSRTFRASKMSMFKISNNRISNVLDAQVYRSQNRKISEIQTHEMLSLFQYIHPFLNIPNVQCSNGKTFKISRYPSYGIRDISTI